MDTSVIETMIIPWAIKIVIALAIFVIGRWVAKAITNALKKAMTKSNMDSMLVNFIGGIVYALLLVAVILAALDSLGINVTSLLAIVGAAGLAVGLALKDSLANFAAGVMIIIFRPFKIGDFISGGGETGVVDEIGLFCTLMHTPDNKRIIVPNSAIINGSITNVSALPTRRVDLVMGISYDDNIGTAKDVIAKVVASDDRVLADPETVIAVSELGDSSVNLVVRPWVNAGDYWPVYFDLTEKLKIALEEAGCSIPYPQQDVYMHQVSAANE